MDYNKYDFLTKNEVSVLRTILDYLVLIPIAIMSFFVLTTTNVHDDFRFSLMHLIKHPPVVRLFHLPAPVASVGIIPSQNKTLVAPSEQPIVSQPAQEAATIPQYKQQAVTIKAKDNWQRIFKRLNIDAKTTTSILAINKSIKELHNLQKGQTINFYFDNSNSLQKITYQPDFKTTITFAKENNFQANITVLTPMAKLEYMFAPIQGSIFTAARKAGVSKKLLSQIANIFNSKMNLSKGIANGDKIAFLLKNYYVADKKIGDGEVVAAEVIHKGHSFALISFTDDKGNTDFYTSDGYSFKSPFVRFPVRYKEISSRFSTGRMHPILGYVRPHTGVDLAANYGTPIKATSDGTISFAGYREGLGKTIEIKHSQYATVYGHMEGFAKGIKSGQTIHQGQVIGFIGSTGLSTGPHLHYEFHINGKAYDPLKVKLPDKEMIAAKYRSRFLAQSKKIMSALNSALVKTDTAKS